MTTNEPPPDDRRTIEARQDSVLSRLAGAALPCEAGDGVIIACEDREPLVVPVIALALLGLAEIAREIATSDAGANRVPVVVVVDEWASLVFLRGRFLKVEGAA